MSIQNIEPGFKKYLPYLNVRYKWDGLNCFTLVEDIYKNFLGITFLEHFKRAGVAHAKLNKKEWHIEFNREFFKQERKHWMEIDPTNIQEYDLLIFYVRKNRIGHFGVYIAQNTFIHIEEESYCMFQVLNQEYRDRLWGVYRR